MYSSIQEKKITIPKCVKRDFNLLRPRKDYSLPYNERIGLNHDDFPTSIGRGFEAAVERNKVCYIKD